MKHILKKALAFILTAATLISCASLTGLAYTATDIDTVIESPKLVPHYDALDKNKNPVWTEECPCPTVIAKDESLSDDWFVYGLAWYICNKYKENDEYGYFGNYITTTSGNYEIVYADQKFSPYVGTGSVINVYDGSNDNNLVESYYVVIFGDVNGDSISDETDVALIYNEMKGKTSWSNPKSKAYDPCKVKAADMDGNGIIDLFDHSVVKGFVTAIYTIDQRNAFWFDDNDELYTLSYFIDNESYGTNYFYQLPYGAAMTAPTEIPVKEGYKFNGWVDYETGKPLETVMPARNVFAYASWVSVCEHSYTSSITTPASCEEDGVITYTCNCGDAYTQPIPATGHTEGPWETVLEPTTEAEGKKIKKCTVCGSKIAEETIEKISFNFEIRNPSRTAISYGDIIVLHADGEIPAGYTVKWSADNYYFTYKANNTTCSITPEKSGDTVFTASLYDTNGNLVAKDEQTMTSKAGFFQKIWAIIKKLFGLNKTYLDVFNGIF